MSEADRLAMRRLESIVGFGKPATYQELMDIMVSTTDVDELCYRDYRQTSYGFSVVKCKEPMDFRHIAESVRHDLHFT
jgi:hypothetical protein